MEVRRQLVVAPAHQHIADIAGDHLLPRLNAGPLLAFAVFTGTNLQAALAGALEPEEMAHLAWVAEQPENLANSRRALADYIALIREEGLRRSGTDEEALLRAAQKRYQETKAYMERIGNLIENPGLYPNMTGYENLKCKCIAMGIYKKGYIEEILKQVGLENDRKKKVKNYSLGMKQRLGIGMALVGEPDLLILDEPINGLDPQGIAEIRDTLKRLNQKKGITILISSHILEELYKVADTFGIINQGELILELSKEELEKRCSDYIEIQTEDVQKTCTVLETLGIHEYKVTENHVIHIYEELEKAAWLNTELVKQGCVLDGFRVAREKLENYFLELTGGAKNV